MVKKVASQISYDPLVNSIPLRKKNTISSKRNCNDMSLHVTKGLSYYQSNSLSQERWEKKIKEIYQNINLHKIVQKITNSLIFVNLITYSIRYLSSFVGYL